MHARLAAIVDDPLAPRASPGAVDGRAGRRRRRVLDDAVGPGSRSWRVGRRRRARRARAPADAARRPTSVIAGRSPQPVRTRRRASGRARGRSPPTCSPRRASARCARGGPRAPRRPRARRTRRSELLEEALREATSAPALQVGNPQRSPGRRASGRVRGRARRHARAALELADDLDDDALPGPALVDAQLARRASRATPAPRRTQSAREDVAAAAGDARLLREATPSR